MHKLGTRPNPSYAADLANSPNLPHQKPVSSEAATNKCRFGISPLEDELAVGHVRNVLKPRGRPL